MFTTSGGTAPLCKQFVKKLASTIALSKNERYEDVIFHLRVRIRFAILRSTLISVQGQRGIQIRGVESVEETSFNLIPEAFKIRDKA